MNRAALATLISHMDDARCGPHLKVFAEDVQASRIDPSRVESRRTDSRADPSRVESARRATFWYAARPPSFVSSSSRAPDQSAWCEAGWRSHIGACRGSHMHSGGQPASTVCVQCSIFAAAGRQVSRGRVAAGPAIRHARCGGARALPAVHAAEPPELPNSEEPGLVRRRDRALGMGGGGQPEWWRERPDRTRKAGR